MNFSEQRRRFLKKLFHPFTFLGAVAAYITGKFAESGRVKSKRVIYDLSDSHLKMGEVKDLGKVFLIRDEEGLFALKAKCTHLGCKPIWNGKLFHCPCHGSEFDLEGDVVHGPAKRHLEALLIKKSGDKLIIFPDRPAPFSQRVKVD